MGRAGEVMLACLDVEKAACGDPRRPAAERHGTSGHISIATAAGQRRGDWFGDRLSPLRYRRR
jgi:hypothetical protein